MRIPEALPNNTGEYKYASPQRAETIQGPLGAQINRRVDIGLPETGDYGRNNKLSYDHDSDILDLDWNRIRRFMQRYSWQVDTPDVMKDMADFQGKRAPIFNFDGDRVEFDFKRTQNNKNNTYGNENIGKASPMEPKGECQTCSNRKYVDKSNDSSVSYQTPTKLNPSTAALAVGAHEREHVVNERAKANREGREIINQTVSIKYAICPECHKMYAAGGVTRTQSIKRGVEEETPATEKPSPEKE